MKDFFEFREAYRKPTAAEIAADKAKERKASGSKGPDSSARYKNIKKKVYGNMMGGLKKEEPQKESVELGEAAWERPFKGHDWGNKDGMLMHTGKKLRKNPKLKGGVKKLYVHHSTRLSVIAVTDDKKSVQLIKGVPDGFTGRVDVFNDIATLAYHYGLKPVRPGDKHTEFTASGVKANESVDLEEEKYAVKYTHPTDKKSGRTVGPMSRAAANKKAAMGNRVDKVGGRYTVIRHVEEVTEAKLSDMGIHNKIADRNLLIKAIKTAEKMGGNMTGAVREIEKMKKGLSKHKAVQAALRQANESVTSADKKPQNYRDPETGKMKVRMVAVDKDISSKKVNESVELEERTNSVKYSRKDFENTKKGDKLEIKWGDSISSGRSATFVVAGKSASKKYNVEKLRLEPEGKKGGVKFFLRSRNGEDATFSIGDMAAIMTSIKKV